MSCLEKHGMYAHSKWVGGGGKSFYKKGCQGLIDFKRVDIMGGGGQGISKKI